MKNFLLFLLFTAFSFTSYAQFYDDDDEVVFYENIEDGDIIAFNLYGDKGVVVGNIGHGITSFRFYYTAGGRVNQEKLPKERYRK